ncbi:17deacda-cf9a-40b1-aaad-6bd4d9ff64aa [Thermothielavioides terrestris]|uniref:17deacda-cf9a-40b1-aaad-6bd4d9ff64aa n=1 Tax=Thermothielavioides terrestris TaxID=2587410 RepID=A0A3S4AUR5_9PEZI|nr:17deacda-cf9a-40b1-aaad-6bd4d9ff64aa [Thermothielavioides terrestris]
MLLSAALLAFTASAAVVIIPGGGDPKPYNGPAPVTSADAFFRQSAPNEFLNNTAKVIESSLAATNLTSAPGLYPSGDSFIRGAIQAWGEHLHLVVRPDEVWFTILVQLNFYMLSHSADVRPLFTDSTNRTEIYVEDVSWPAILTDFAAAIQAHVKPAWLLDWLVPSFSTSTRADALTAAVLLMGLAKAYFKYVAKLVCGLPSVTLLGTRADWAALLAKLDRLPAFGDEPAAYAARLRPILRRFVASFDDPDAEDTRRFWNQIVSARAAHVCGEPPVYLTGWIGGFYYWNGDGGAFGRPTGRRDALVLDGVEYPVLDLTTVPVGYATAPLVLRDWDGVKEFPAFVAAETLGKQITIGPPDGYKEALERSGDNVSLAAVEAEQEHATLRPLSGWMLYGPLEDHNATSSALVEEELQQIQAGIVRFMTGETCGLADAP